MKSHNKVMLTILAFALCGCSGDIKSTLGMQKSAPDEFSVTAASALTMPPTFELPTPGEKANHPALTTPSSLTATEVEFLAMIDAHSVRSNSDIKSTIDDDMQKRKTANKGIIRRTVQKLNTNTEAKSIDPEKEKLRIEHNQATGKEINEGEVALKPDGSSTLEKLLGN